MEDIVLMVLVLAFTGLIAGLGAGLLGVGGGFIMVPAQFWVLTDFAHLDPTLATRVAFATSLAVILPTAISSAYCHHRNHAVDWDMIRLMALPGFLMAFGGAYVATNVHGDGLRLVFGVLLLGAAVRMFFRSSVGNIDIIPHRALFYIGGGVLFGFLSGLLGIGGGYLIVIYLTAFCGFTIHRAVATSTGFLVFAAMGGIIAYTLYGWGVTGIPGPSLGYIDLPQWAVLTLTSIPASYLGVHISHLTSPRRLEYLFVLLLFVSSMKMFGLF
ncbi:MAG TPA: sulfite exporter TauE/SafE family protein [Methanoculleus sp.]|nr:sulfite exporter TauE/SafE family protein [Methanoculleus sp.]